MIGAGKHQELAERISAELGGASVLLVVATDRGINTSGSVKPAELPAFVRCLRLMADDFARDAHLVAERN